MNKHFRKLAAVLLAAAMAISMAIPAWADETDDSGVTDDVSGTIYVSNYKIVESIDETDHNNDLKCRDTLIYKDGKKTQQAYANRIELSVVDSRIRLTPGQDIKTDDKGNITGLENQITVQLNGRNFTYFTPREGQQNYEITSITYQNNKLSYTIALNNVNYNGSGDGSSDDNTLRLDVSYAFNAGKSLPLATIEQRLSRFGTQTETSPDPTPEPTATPEPTPTPDPTYRTPSLIVRSTSIGGSSVDAGDDFTLSLEIYATSSGTEALCDVLVSISTADGVTLANGSTTQYIGDMAPGTSQTVTYPMHAQNSFTGGTSSVSVSLSANGKTTGGGAQATGTTVTVPIIQPERFEISNVEIPETLTVGEENYGSITFVNKGKNELSNMTVTITGTNLQEAEQSSYVGNLAAGSEQSVDINLCALQAGTVEGTINITYEDTSGKEVNIARNFSASAEEGASWDWENPDIDDIDSDIPEEKQGLPIWAWILIAAVAAALGFAGFKIVKKRKAAKSQEENDADF